MRWRSPLPSERSPTARGNHSSGRPSASCAEIKISGMPSTVEMPGGSGRRFGSAKTRSTAPKTRSPKARDRSERRIRSSTPSARRRRTEENRRPPGRGARLPRWAAVVVENMEIFLLMGSQPDRYPVRSEPALRPAEEQIRRHPRDRDQQGDEGLAPSSGVRNSISGVFPKQLAPDGIVAQRRSGPVTAFVALVPSTPDPQSSTGRNVARSISQLELGPAEARER